MPVPPVILCFAGQGSQYFHMASALHREEPVFRQWMQIGDEILRDHGGVPVTEAIYDPARRPGDSFDRMEASHPAVFLVQYALAKTLLHHGVAPDALLGISLGEITAMTLAGMHSFEPMLVAVAEQAALYRACCPPGGMTAVLGPASLHAGLAGECDLAGVNAEGHIVLSGPLAGLDAAEAMLGAQGVAFQRLPVPFAFHSRWIAPAEDAVRARFAGAARAPRWPCWSCCRAAPIAAALPDAGALAWSVVREPMQLLATVRRIEALGGATYVDASPSGTIAALLRQVLGRAAASRVVPVLSPFGDAAAGLARALALLARRD